MRGAVADAEEAEWQQGGSDNIAGRPSERRSGPGVPVPARLARVNGFPLRRYRANVPRRILSLPASPGQAPAARHELATVSVPHPTRGGSTKWKP
ncbi:hypothetical protein GCM10023323_15080 [Streptomyces thinghirensis]|uniref:Uncharacterized protein n=1 Tax=Streptomyces thinghirensis TaxID=551547 RepID=A0ABP9T1I0_9ACTN